MLLLTANLLTMGCGRLGFEDVVIFHTEPDAGFPSEDGATEAPLAIASGPSSTVPQALPAFGAGWDPPVPIAALNSAADEDDVTLTADMLELYFERDDIVMRSVRASTTDAWSAPVEVSELTGAGTINAPDVSADGLTMIFALGNGVDRRLHVAERATRANAWTLRGEEQFPSPPPALLGPTFGSDRRSVFFVAQGVSIGGLDLFGASRSGTTGPFTTVTDLVMLNSSEGEGGPFYHRATRRLYFASRRAAGHADLYEAVIDPDTFQSQSLQPLTGTNSDFEDADPWLSPDGRTLFFASDRSGSFDLYVATR